MKYEPKLSKYGYYYAYPTPTEDEIKKYYEEEFYQKPKVNINDSSLEVRDRDKEFYDYWYSFYLDLIPKTLSPSSLLDLGCGYGHFLSYVKNNSKISSLTGVEPFPEFLEYVKSIGLNGHVSTLESFTDNSNEVYDVVTMINVLEHINNPEKVLNNISKNILSNEGCLILQVPNDFNIIQEIAVEKNACDQWWYCPPIHISYFSPSSLTKLLSTCGFSKIETFCSFPIDMFLLMKRDYVSNPELGRQAHLDRLEFEKSFLKSNNAEKLKKIYKSFSDSEIGREIICIARL